MSFWDDLGEEEKPAAPAATPAPAPDKPAEPSFWDTLSKDTAPPKEEEQSLPWSQVAAKAGYSVIRPDEQNSALQFGKNLVHPFLHPQETLEGMGKIGLGVLEKVGGKMGLPHDQGYEQYADAVGEHLMARYGSMDNFKKTLARDPVGVAADVSMLFTGGGSAVARIPGIVGRVGEGVATVGRAADPLNAVTVPAKIAGKAAAATLGYDTGAGMRNIEEAAHAGFEGGEAAKEFKKYQTGTGTPEEFVNYAMNAKKNLLKDRGLDFEAGMVPVKNANQILSFSDIGNAMRDAHKVTNFKGEPINLNPGVRSILGRIDDQIFRWHGLDPAEFHTPSGFDALKKSIGSLRDKFEVGTPEWKAANGYYKAIDNTIRKQVPEYGKVMKDYAEFSQLIEQIEKSLSLPRDVGKVNFDTATRKLQSVLRRNVNTNFGQREKLVDVLEGAGAPHLKAAIAGMALSSPEAHGLVRLIPALRSFGWSGLVDAAKSLGMSSPRLGGNIAYTAGRIASPLRPYQPLMTKPALKATQLLGRLTTSSTEPYRGPNLGPLQQARGGAVDRALRTAKDMGTDKFSTDSDTLDVLDASRPPEHRGVPFDPRDLISPDDRTPTPSNFNQWQRRI